MSQEYDTLRQEALLWQTRRFTVVSASLVLTGAVLGWAHGTQEFRQAASLSCFLLVFLSTAIYLSPYCGIASAKIGAYIQVFHETRDTSCRWQTRNLRLPHHAALAPSLAILYLALGLIICASPFVSTSSIPLTKTIWWACLPAGALCVLFLPAVELNKSKIGNRSFTPQHPRTPIPLDHAI